MSALSTQVGGDHYAGRAIQPFEFSIANGLDPIQHTAIKYVTRHRQKGGRQDLEKALHCIDLMGEVYAKHEGAGLLYPVATANDGIALEDYALANGLTKAERQAILHIMRMRYTDTLFPEEADAASAWIIAELAASY